MTGEKSHNEAASGPLHHAIEKQMLMAVRANASSKNKHFCFYFNGVVKLKTKKPYQNERKYKQNVYSAV